MKEFDKDQVVEIRDHHPDGDHWLGALYVAGAGEYHSVMIEGGIKVVVEDTDIRLIRKTPAEWEEIDNVTVMDPDGWRFGDVDDLNAVWQIPIDREEWEDRMSQSTIMPGKMTDRPAEEFILCNNEGIYGALAKRERELLNELEQIQEKMREFSDES